MLCEIMTLLGSESLTHSQLASDNTIIVLCIDNLYLLRVKKYNQDWYIDSTQFKQLCKSLKIKLQNITTEYFDQVYWINLNRIQNRQNLHRLRLVFSYINDALLTQFIPARPVQVDNQAALINNVVARFESRLSNELSSIHHILQSRTVVPKASSADEHYLVIFRSNTNDHLYYFFRIQFKSLSTRIASLQKDPRFPGGLTLLRYFQTPNAIRLFNNMILKFSDYLIRNSCCTVIRKPGLWSEKEMIENIYLFYDMPYVADTLAAPLPESEKVVTPLAPGETRDYQRLRTDQTLLSN